MAHLLLHHKVQNFDTWKAVYAQHASARAETGVKELQLLRGLADPNDVVILFALEDLAKARAFASSDDLKAAMARAGVIDTPVFLELQ